MKRTSKIVLILVVWFVLTMAIVSWSLNFISEAETSLNIIGLGILVCWALISYNTSCFTNISIKFNKKNK